VVALISVLATDPAPGPYLVVMLFGFALGGFGHLISSRVLIAAGILVIAVTTALFIAATNPMLGG
jgi:hypothetical protein